MSGLVNFLNKADRVRKAEGTVFTREQYQAWRRQKVEQWHALPPFLRTAHQAEAQVLNARKECAEVEADEHSLAPSSNKMETVLDAAGDHKTPFTAEAFQSTVNDVIKGHDSQLPGLRQYEPAFRGGQQAKIFVEDLVAPAPAKALRT